VGWPFLLQLNNLENRIAPLINRLVSLGDFSFAQFTEHSLIVPDKLRQFEPGTSRTWMYHNPPVHPGVFVMREIPRPISERKGIPSNHISNTVQTKQHFRDRFSFNLRLADNMPDFHLIASFLNQLNDVKTELGLYHTRNVPRLFQGKGRTGKVRIQAFLRSGNKVQFSPGLGGRRLL